jgi:hypothetical protein
LEYGSEGPADDDNDYDPTEHVGTGFDSDTEDDVMARFAATAAAATDEVPPEGPLPKKQQRQAAKTASLNGVVANAKPAATVSGLGHRPSGVQGAMQAIAASLQQPSARFVMIFVTVVGRPEQSLVPEQCQRGARFCIGT